MISYIIPYCCLRTRNQTNHVIEHIVVADKENDRVLLIDIAVPGDMHKSRRKGAGEGGQMLRPGKENYKAPEN